VPYRLNKNDPNWVPPLRVEAAELLTPSKNPFHDHARMQLFLARRGGAVVGRISAHIDELALQQPPEQGMGPGTGNWGLFEAADRDVAQALITRAEQWLREQGMTRVLAPLSQSVWEEPGLLVYGHDTPPAIMMGHDDPRHQEWIEGLGYTAAKSLITYAVPVDHGFPELINRIVASGERNPRIRIRPLDKAQFDHEAAIVLEILNDAWSGNWGFVPFTEAEKVYGGRKLKPLIIAETNMVAELDGEPVAFMLALPDVNEVIKPFNGRLFPFNWIKLMLWLRNPRSRTFRVPLMGVRRRLQNSRLASQLAFMMIEYIRREAVAKHGCVRGEIGWVLEDNKGMVAIAEAINSKVNREYRVYQKPLA
jgi:GNAT superfamily N-acetyltransferase